MDVRLHRSRAEEIEHPLWELADQIYSCMGARDYDGVISAMKTHKLALDKRQKAIFCPRRGDRVGYMQCIHCRTVPEVRKRFRETAEKRKIRWQEEPCAFECGMGNPDDVPGGYKTIDESIAQNSWAD